MYPPHGQPAPGTDMQSRLTQDAFANVQPHLRIVITRDARQVGAGAVAYAMGEDLAAVVCVRVSDRAADAAVVGSQHTWAWRMPPEHLWSHALTNMRGEQFNVQEYNLNDVAPLRVVTGQTWPGTAHLPRLGEVIGHPAPHGAVVMLANENSMMYLPLLNRAVPSVLPFVYQTFQSLVQGGQPMSDRMYWWTPEGTLEDMGAQPHPEVQGSVRLSISSRLKQVLEQLPG